MIEDNIDMEQVEVEGSGKVKSKKFLKAKRQPYG